jgi:hypothetical protein
MYIDKKFISTYIFFLTFSQEPIREMSLVNKFIYYIKLEIKRKNVLHVNIYIDVK